MTHEAVAGKLDRHLRTQDNFRLKLVAEYILCSKKISANYRGSCVYEVSGAETLQANIILCKNIMFSAMFVRCKLSVSTNGGREIL